MGYESGGSKLAVCATGGKVTIYHKEGLRADLDESAVSLYLEGVHVVTMTLDEWNAVNAAIMEVKE